MDGCSERLEIQAVVQWINSSSSRARELISQDWRGFGFLFSKSRVRFREGLDVDWAGKQTGESKLKTKLNAPSTLDVVCVA